MMLGYVNFWIRLQYKMVSSESVLVVFCPALVCAKPKNIYYPIQLFTATLPWYGSLLHDYHVQCTRNGNSEILGAWRNWCFMYWQFFLMRFCAWKVQKMLSPSCIINSDIDHSSTSDAWNFLHRLYPLLKITQHVLPTVGWCCLQSQPTMSSVAKDLSVSISKTKLVTCISI